LVVVAAHAAPLISVDLGRSEKRPDVAGELGPL